MSPGGTKKPGAAAQGVQAPIAALLESAAESVWRKIAEHIEERGWEPSKDKSDVSSKEGTPRTDGEFSAPRFDPKKHPYMIIRSPRITSQSKKEDRKPSSKEGVKSPIHLTREQVKALIAQEADIHNKMDMELDGAALVPGRENFLHLQRKLSNTRRSMSLLSDLFEVVSDLPAGEIERLLVTAKKKAEFWCGNVPKSAPELYENRRANETLPEFLIRVYGDYVCGSEAGQTTITHLQLLDKKLGDACAGYLRNHKSFPSGIILARKFANEPTISEPSPQEL